MNANGCCQATPSGNANADSPKPQHKPRRFRDGLNWVVPSTILALMPKCPACVAGYIALGTGIGISLPAATFLRAFLIMACCASLLFMCVRRVRGFVANRVKAG